MGLARKHSELGRRQGRRPWGALFSVLTAPAVGLDPVGRARRAQLLAGLLLLLVCFGWLSGVVQLAAVPGFLPTFLAMSGALLLLTGAYVASRTRAYEIGAGLACAVPVVACFIVITRNPGDRAAFAFMILGVLFATLFLSTRAAIGVAAGALALLGAAFALVPALRSAERCLPALAFHVVVSPLLIVGSWHRNRIERELEDELRAQRRLATVGRMTVGLGHDLNNLLTVLLGNLALLEPARDDASLAQQARAAGDLAARLVRQAATLARGSGEPTPRPVELNALVEETAALIECALGRVHHLTLRRAPGPVVAMADPLELQRILLNLALNAGAAMREMGQLTIEMLPAQRRDAGGPLGLPAGTYVALVVSDTGPGIPQSVRARSSTAFATAAGRDGRLGLGLAIIEDLVRRQGGAIDVHSGPGQGTRFEIVLPQG